MLPSLLNQTTPFCITECIASPARRRLPQHYGLCFKNCARVARPSILCAGDAIHVHQELQKGVVWLIRLRVPYLDLLSVVFIIQDGRTALTHASWYGQASTCKALLHYGAAIGHKDNISIIIDMFNHIHIDLHCSVD